MINTLLAIPQYKLFRVFGYPKKMPLSITLSVSYNCNSRCKTCNVWKKKTDDLSINELNSIFKSLGKSPYWFTISGGEPFLRKDIVDICQSAYSNCSPGIINIATNGILCNIIPDSVKQIAESCPKTHIVVNLSLDGIGSDHDEIRRVPGNWEKAMKTYYELRDLKYPNFLLGIHTVISKYNVGSIPDIYKYVTTELKPDSYITEIAEERVELDTIGAGISPSPEDYSKAIDFLSQGIKHHDFSGISKTTQAFRAQYYSMVKKVLISKRQIIPCYAGFASAQIAPDGDVWTCCIRAEPIGNLRDNNYNFSEVWNSNKAREIRASIKNKECYCPLANASYTNMLCHIPTLAKVGWNIITS